MPSIAHTVAVATPCWPAPVSAMMRCFLLAHVACQQPLTKRIVDLVSAGVGEILALEKDARAAQLLASADSA